MPEAFAVDTAGLYRKRKVSAGELAGQQWGVIGSGQLHACGVNANMRHRWRTDGRLYLIHHGVYSLGHPQVPIEGRLVAALLYAGDDAVLSHGTAAWWWGLVDKEPEAVEVSARSCVRSCRGVLVHRRRHIDVTRHRRFPITTVPETLRDYAVTAALIDVRHALAKADYLRLLDPADVQAACGKGRSGSATLRVALGRHLPRLARARSWLELEFIPLCEAARIPLPEINVKLEGWTVDALWRRERLVVELDGYGNHSTRAQMERDRREELHLRAAGFLVIRYTRDQVVREPELVAVDLLARLEERRRSPDSRSRARPIC